MEFLILPILLISYQEFRIELNSEEYRFILLRNKTSIKENFSTP